MKKLLAAVIIVTSLMLTGCTGLDIGKYDRELGLSVQHDDMFGNNIYTQDLLLLEVNTGPLTTGSAQFYLRYNEDGTSYIDVVSSNSGNDQTWSTMYHLIVVNRKTNETFSYDFDSTSGGSYDSRKDSGRIFVSKEDMIIISDLLTEEGNGIRIQSSTGTRDYYSTSNYSKSLYNFITK